MSKAEQPNELSPELLGANALNPFPGHDSSSRAVMISSHVGQALVVDGATVRRCQTGVEREYAKYTFKIKMPCDALIIRCMHKYPPTVGETTIKENPLTAVVYRDCETNEVGVLELPTYNCLHQSFGFRYVYKKAIEQLIPGNFIPKDTVLADSPAVTDEGDYKYGVETQIAMMSYQPVIEDGIIASEEYLERLKTRGYGSRRLSWGKNYFPLNLYGDDQHYKPFPDVGDKIRPDGLLFALRAYDELLAPVHMTPRALQEVDYVFDKTVYAEPNARVIDAVVYKGNNNKSNMPSGMEEQTEKYHRKEYHFYKQLIEEYQSLRNRDRDELRLTPAFHRLLVEGLAFTNDDPNHRVNKTINRSPLDEWCVDITFEYEMVPTIGSKLTDLHGGRK